MYQGEDVYLAYAPIESAGWSVGIVIPESEIIRPAQQVGAAIAEAQQQLRTQVLAVFALSVVAVLALGAVFCGAADAAAAPAPVRRAAHRRRRSALPYDAGRQRRDRRSGRARSMSMSNALNQKLVELEKNLRAARHAERGLE